MKTETAIILLNSWIVIYLNCNEVKVMCNGTLYGLEKKASESTVRFYLHNANYTNELPTCFRNLIKF